MTVDVHELLARTHIGNRSEILHQDVAVHVDGCVQRVKSHDMEAVGDTQRSAAVTVLVIHGGEKPVGQRVLGVGDLAVRLARDRLVVLPLGEGLDLGVVVLAHG